jgi:hypothetical protein
MLLLAFGNKARNGKDTAAEAVRDYFNEKRNRALEYYGSAKGVPEARIFKFAEALYEECRRDHGMTTKDPALLQRVGLTRREQDPEYWIKQCYAKILDATSLKGGIAMITDVRYKNEAEFIKGRDGFLVNVARINPDGTRYISDDRDSNHPSETDLDDWNWDYQIATKDPILTGEFAVTLVEYLKGFYAK